MDVSIPQGGNAAPTEDAPATDEAGKQANAAPYSVNAKVSEEDRGKLQSAGIMQSEDGTFYEHGKPLNDSATGKPMTTEQVKAYANERNPGLFPDAGKGNGQDPSDIMKTGMPPPVPSGADQPGAAPAA